VLHARYTAILEEGTFPLFFGIWREISKLIFGEAAETDMGKRFIKESIF